MNNCRKEEISTYLYILLYACVVNIYIRLFPTIFNPLILVQTLDQLLLRGRNCQNTSKRAYSARFFWQKLWKSPTSHNGIECRFSQSRFVSPIIILSMLICFCKAGVKTGPVTGQPPPVSSETAAALLGASNSDPLRQHEGGQDGGDKLEGKKIKSEKERMDPS